MDTPTTAVLVPPLRPIRANRIRMILDQRALDNPDAAKDDRPVLNHLIGQPKRVARILNNVAQLTIDEAVAVSQWLGLQVEDLLVLGPAEES